MSLRTKAFITAALLLLALFYAGLAAHVALGALQRFQQQTALIRSEDVHTIRPWMTIPYIARLYHVPEDYLYLSLDLPTDRPPRHSTLHAIAMHKRLSVNTVIGSLQTAITEYRQQHHHFKPSRFHPHAHTATTLQRPGRTSP